MGKREHKMVERKDFVCGAEIDEKLKELGIPEEILAYDLNSSLSLESRPVSIGSAEFTINGETYQITAEEISGKEDFYIVNWLDAMPVELFLLFWENKEYHDKIAALMRYPGGWHEWLMIAALPLLKVMGISMEYVKQIRTPTAETQFDFNGGQGSHGGKGSTIMHRDLFSCIADAYMYCVNKQADPLEVLKESLNIFTQTYYTETDIPEILKDFLGL